MAVTVLLGGPGTASPQARSTPPVLAFPEAGLDDSAAYHGYQTRFYRDARGNAVQIYLDPIGGRVVTLLADADNESVGFTVRDSAGHPVPLAWGATDAVVSVVGARRTIAYRMTARAPRVDIGWHQLGSMRVERDLQYARRHLDPFAAPAFNVREIDDLLASLQRLDSAEQRRHLGLLNARTLSELEARTHPVTTALAGERAGVRIAQESLDGRNHLVLELVADGGEVAIGEGGRTVTVRAKIGGSIALRVRVTTDAAPLTPLTRGEIFNREYLAFAAAARRRGDDALRAGPRATAADTAVILRARQMERQMRSVELLATREKLMAGLPNYATYFGRDMMMTALMMEPIWSGAMSEHVIASVLRKLGPAGSVSHEEALGGQAIRESAAEYSGLVSEYLRQEEVGDADSARRALRRAREVLATLHRARENYHMIDGEFQLPVLTARYLSNPAVSTARKRAFLMETRAGGSPRVALLLREMNRAAGLAAPYVKSPAPTQLVPFPEGDSTHWRSASWRDSGAGYANGRFAMDINAIWVPQALSAIDDILSFLGGVGLTSRQIIAMAPEIAGRPLGGFVMDRASLRAAMRVWDEAVRHFVVRLSGDGVRERVQAKLRSLPSDERAYWERVVTANRADRDSLEFLALALDAAGGPIPVVNTDPATWLFLRDRPVDGPARWSGRERALRDVRSIMRHYPVGLFVDGLGPLVANDAYASPAVWEAFRRDTYHSPRVVWGREVNLLMLGLARRIVAASRDSLDGGGPATADYERELEDALRRTAAAVAASGLGHNELWSYRIKDGRLEPARYDTSTDIQLWNVTELAVDFALARVRAPGRPAR